MQATDSDTVNVRPATVIVPVRAADPVLAATVKCSAPLPVPDPSLAIVIHAALLAAVHAQPAVVVTFTVPPPPLEVKDWLVGVIA